MFNQTMDDESSSQLRLTLTLTTLGAAPTVSPQQQSSHASGMAKQMTIFYGGRVFVLQNVSSHKANEIMRLASSSQKQVETLPNTFVNDLSQTRTRSLMRFFEKRFDRIKARAPYAVSENSRKAAAPGHKSWLHLASGNQ